MVRFSRLFTPASMLNFAAIALGVTLGTLYGLNNLHHNIAEQGYSIPVTEWGRFVGDVWAIAPHIAATTLIFSAIATVLAPDERKSDRQVLRRIARAKLSQEYLSEADNQLWSQVLHEVERHD